MKRLIFLLLASCMATGFSLDGWETDMAVARKKAAEEGLDLMIVYKGADWCPEQVGRPEKLLTYRPFQDKAREKFIMVEQFTPPDALEKNKEPVLIFADAQGRPFYGFDSELKQGFDWAVEEMKIAGECKAPVLAQVASVEKAAPNKKKEQVERLWILFPKKYASFSPVYESWKKESDKTSDKSAKEKIPDGEELMSMMGDMFAGEATEGGKLMNQVEGALAGEIKEGNENLKVNLTAVFIQFIENLDELKKQDKLTLDEQQREEALAMEKLDRLIAAAPEKKTSRMGNIVVRNVLKGSGPLYRFWVNNKAEDISDSRLKELEEMSKTPGWSLENRQIIECLYADKLLRIGDAGGVDVLKKAMETAPWTENAESIMDVLPRLEENRGKFSRLRRKELKGDKEAGHLLEELIAYKLTRKFEL